MQVILVEDVQHLGSLGDEVYVKDGYARNYLLPRGMAIVAGSRKSREIEHQRKRLEVLRQDAIEKAQAESDKVAALELTVQAKAGASGKLFGSVTNRDIQAALAEQGYQLDRRSIQLSTLIKSVGNFTATVRLHTDVKVEVNIKVEPLIEAGATAPAESGEEAADAPPADGGQVAEGAASEGTDAADGDDGTAAAAGTEEAATAESGEAAPAAEAAEAAEPATVNETADESADAAVADEPAPAADEQAAEAPASDAKEGEPAAE